MIFGLGLVMRSALLLIALFIAGTGAAQARDPVTGLVHSFFGGYREPPYPAAGDCREIAAAIGPEATWFGSFSGNREVTYREYQPFGAQGCFPSEVHCRIWQHRAMNYAHGPVVVTSCRRGVPGMFR